VFVILNKNNDPAFNLACEEYLLKNKREDIAMLWQNDNAVIIGRNQIIENEVDAEYAEKHGIKVVRRQTGGGAVYHDLGNINYTFIARGAGGYFNDYIYFTRPITAFLQKLGIKAEFSGRNDIVAGGRKISGTAQVMYKDDVLFHGTLLVDTDIERLKSVLKPDYEKLGRHGIKSIVSRVVNLNEYTRLSAEELMRLLYAEFLEGGEDYQLSADDIKETEIIARNKYRSREWNYLGVCDGN